MISITRDPLTNKTILTIEHMELSNLLDDGMGNIQNAPFIYVDDSMGNDLEVIVMDCHINNFGVLYRSGNKQNDENK